MQLFNFKNFFFGQQFSKRIESLSNELSINNQQKIPLTLREEILFLISQSNTDKLVPYLVQEMSSDFFNDSHFFSFLTHSFQHYFLHIKKYQLKINNNSFIPVFKKIFELFSKSPEEFPFSLFFNLSKILSFNNPKLTIVNTIDQILPTILLSFLEFLPALKYLSKIEEIAIYFVSNNNDFYKSLFHSLESNNHIYQKKLWKLFQGILQFPSSQQKIF